MKFKFDIGVILTRMMYILLAITLFIMESTGQRPGVRLLTCRNCLGNSPNCGDTCRGHYCYKAEFIADGYATVKRGCLNETDGGVRVGGCDDTPSSLPGSDVQATERMCICTTDRCNLASAQSMTFIVLGLIALFIFYEQ